MCLHDCPQLNCLLPMLCKDDAALGGVSVCRVWLELVAVW